MNDIVKEQKVKTGRFFWGVFLLVLGFLYLLSKFTEVSTWFAGFPKFWPLVIIFIGVGILATNSIVKMSMSALSGAILAAALFGLSTNNWFCNDGFNFHVNDKGEEWETSVTSDTNFRYSDSIKYVNMDFELGALGLIITDSTDKLYEVFANKISYNVKSTSLNDSTYDVSLEINDDTVVLDSNSNRSMAVKLNTAPIYNMDFAIGAASLNLDLRKFKINGFKLDGGAASVSVILAEPANSTSNVDIEMGAASFVLMVPKNVGVQVRYSGALVSSNFPGFEKVSDDNYRTPGFDSASKKIFVNFDGGLSSFEIKRQ